MSLISGPKKVPSKETSKLKEAADMAKGVGGAAAVRAAEGLIGVRFDPIPAYLFYVSISGLIIGLFTACDGIGASRSVEELQEGGMNDQVHTLPGPVKAGRVTLKRGLSVSRELWDWFTSGLYDFEVKRVNMSIIQGAPGMNALGAVGLMEGGTGIAKVWDLDGAYPVKWSLSGLDVSSTSQVAIESIEIACKTISLSMIAGTPTSPTALF
jgi:phage tail-like protein